jgi:hypothetical protein
MSGNMKLVGQMRTFNVRDSVWMTGEGMRICVSISVSITQWKQTNKYCQRVINKAVHVNLVYDSISPEWKHSGLTSQEWMLEKGRKNIL